MFEILSAIGVAAIVASAWVTSSPKAYRSGKKFSKFTASQSNYRSGIRSAGYYERNKDRYVRDRQQEEISVKERYSEENPYDIVN